MYGLPVISRILSILKKLDRIRSKLCLMLAILVLSIDSYVLENNIFIDESNTELQHNIFVL